jgi:hypothetical protein
MSKFTRIIEVADLTPGMRYGEPHGWQGTWFLIEDIADMTEPVVDKDGIVTAAPYRGAIVTAVTPPEKGTTRVVKIDHPVRVRVAGQGERQGQPLLYPTTSGVAFKDVAPPAEASGGDRVEQFTTAGGVPYTVRVVPTGAKWGPNLTIEGEEPVVEFYATRGTEPDHGKWGQFVSRYSLDVLMEGDDDRGLFLAGGWSVDPTTTDDIRAWVRRTLTAIYNSSATFHPYSEPDVQHLPCIEVGGVRVYVYVDWQDGGPTLVVSPHFDTTDPGLVDRSTGDVRIAMKNGNGDVIYS